MTRLFESDFLTMNLTSLVNRSMQADQQKNKTSTADCSARKKSAQPSTMNSNEHLCGLIPARMKFPHFLPHPTSLLSFILLN